MLTMKEKVLKDSTRKVGGSADKRRTANAPGREQRRSKFRISQFPVHEGDWDHTVSLRREDLYGDDGR